jgi:hypothetical protein
VVSVGLLSLRAGLRLTSELLSDVESLLIIGEQPPGNKQCTQDRIARPGLLVRCVGNLNGRGAYYYDADVPEASI